MRAGGFTGPLGAVEGRVEPSLVTAGAADDPAALVGTVGVVGVPVPPPAPAVAPSGLLALPQNQLGNQPRPPSSLIA